MQYFFVEGNVLEYKTMITLVERQTLKVVGVNSVIAFDSDYVSINTTDGKLLIHGKQLAITDLSKSNNTIEVVGIIDSIEFDEKKRGIWG